MGHVLWCATHLWFVHYDGIGWLRGGGGARRGRGHRKHVLWCAAHIRFFHDDGKCRVLSHHVSSTSGQQGGPWCGGAWFASAQGVRVGSARDTHGTAAPQRRRPWYGTRASRKK